MYFALQRTLFDRYIAELALVLACQRSSADALSKHFFALMFC